MSTVKVETTQEVEIISYKGFDKNFRCRGYQFEVGKTYTHDGPVVACESGFHSCEHPLDVFAYYSPAAGSRFAMVKASGEISRHGEDTKIASASMTIEAEIGIHELVARAVDWVMVRCTKEGEVAIGFRGAASATGYSGAASATGDSGAASATGDSGAASATGFRGAASATGKSSVACALGRFGRTMAAEGCAIFLVYRDTDMNIVHARASKVGENGIKSGIWYSLDENGEFFEVTS